jgi:GxxExxY protein
MGKKVKGPHEDLTYCIIGAAMAIHRRIGPGEKEVIYQRTLEEGLTRAGLSFEAQKNIPVYDGDRLLGFYIPDFIVEGKVIVEIKAFAVLHQKYLGQVITYLNHTGLPVGLLINFGGRSLRWRRVFPSPQATEFRYNYQWMFVPDWLKAQRQEGSSGKAR